MAHLGNRAGAVRKPFEIGDARLGDVPGIAVRGELIKAAKIEPQ